MTDEVKGEYEIIRKIQQILKIKKNLNKIMLEKHSS